MSSSRNLVYWSVRRELWENRSLYLAPLLVAAVALFGFLLNTFRLPQAMRGLSALDPRKQSIAAIMPYNLIASLIFVTGFLAAVIYCLDALHGERRDRSILFWKSMPVSDRTTVLSKAGIPLAFVPLFTLAVTFVTQAIMLMTSSTALLMKGMNPATLWARLPLFEMPLVTAYGLTVHVLWFAPIYGWLLFVSAWARRAALLWAVLPFFAIYAVERAAFGTAYFPALMKYRVLGAMTEAYDVQVPGSALVRVSELAPLKYLATPGLWVGLAFAAAFLVAAVRLRRQREPS